MTVTAAMVKELRERTGAGMMECKKALTESQGNIDRAVEGLRKKGAASADKKSSRLAAEGLIVIRLTADSKSAYMLEINCETDFVAKDNNFQDFCDRVADLALANSPQSVEALASIAYEEGKSIEEARRELIVKIGENVSIRRIDNLSVNDGQLIAGYLHGSRIGVLVAVDGNDAAVGRDVAMHVAATHPLTISADQLPVDVVEKEKEIFKAQAQASGKPQEIIEKMIAGRIDKFIKENTLLGQAFVKDPDLTVEKFLAKNNSSISHMIRYEVGEGMEKRQDDFVAQVMAQAKGA